MLNISLLLCLCFAISNKVLIKPAILVLLLLMILDILFLKDNSNPCSASELGLKSQIQIFVVECWLCWFNVNAFGFYQLSVAIACIWFFNLCARVYFQITMLLRIRVIIISNENLNRSKHIFHLNFKKLERVFDNFDCVVEVFIKVPCPLEIVYHISWADNHLGLIRQSFKLFCVLFA